MPKNADGKKSDRLALAVASGQSLAAAARSVGIPESTSRRWASDPAFRVQVEGLRRDMITRAVGVLSAGATSAAGVMLQLLKSESEDVRLKAARAILADLLAVSSHAELTDRLAAIESKLAQQEESTRARLY